MLKTRLNGLRINKVLMEYNKEINVNEKFLKNLSEIQNKPFTKPFNFLELPERVSGEISVERVIFLMEESNLFEGLWKEVESNLEEIALKIPLNLLKKFQRGFLA